MCAKALPARSKLKRCPPGGGGAAARVYVQTLDPVQKTLRLALDSPHMGPGVGKGKTVVILLEDIEELA